MALTIEWFLKKYTFWIPLLTIYYFVGLNYHFSERYTLGQVHPDAMSKEMYWWMVSKEDIDGRFWELLDRPSAYSAFIGNDESQTYQRSLFASKTKEFHGGPAQILYSIPKQSFFKQSFETEIRLSASYSRENSENKKAMLRIVMHNSKDRRIFTDHWEDLEIKEGKLNIELSIPFVHDERAQLDLELHAVEGQEIKFRNLNMKQIVW